jgi:hypothetical protein
MQKYLAKHLDIEDDNFIDGDFGPSTQRQVKVFQKRRRLSADGIVGEQTWRALLAKSDARTAGGRSLDNTSSSTDSAIASSSNQGGALVDKVKRCFANNGYDFLDDRQPYQLNIVGVRSTSTQINQFDDELVLIFRDEQLKFKSFRFPITTDPGEKYTQRQLLDADGAAILQPGQYVNCYQIDRHRKSYDALCQRGGRVNVWRDGNRDDRLDRSGRTYSGYFGINIHRANRTGETSRVGPYSAGCQVFKRADDFNFLMKIAYRAKPNCGNRFTYTLIEASDLGL